MNLSIFEGLALWVMLKTVKALDMGDLCKLQSRIFQSCKVLPSIKLIKVSTVQFVLLIALKYD